MSAFNLLRPSHLMTGIDPHDAVMPPALAKVPAIPHPVTARLRGGVHISAPGFSGSVKHTPKVQVCFEDALQRSTDIGMLIVHVGYNVLLPLIMVDSKSKSEFGASTVRVDKRPVATAIFMTSNLNLNCGEPARLPSGFVSAPCTVRAGMTEGDLLAGLVEMGFDIGFGVVKSKLFKAVIMPALSRMLPTSFASLLTKNPIFNQLLEKALKVGFSKATDGAKPSPTFWDGVATEYDDPRHRQFL